ncbi:MAG TPA: choice-of-anchor Q domain-containing protein [Actinomycetota bacterium]|nr:choice-of-anchor Q domain-containing protein [Actinomycetota bacterium]
MTGVRRSGVVLLVLAVVMLVPLPARADHEPPPVDIVVDTFADTYDGSCADGDCSVRDAVASASDGDTVGLPSGVFTLTLAGDGGIDLGDIDVDASITVTGIGETGTFVDASPLGDRAFDLAGADVRLERLTILGGATAGRGGAIRVTDGTAHLEFLSIRGSHARNGGAIAATNAGVRVSQSAFIDNVADRRGGGVSVHGTAVVRILRSSIVGGSARVGGALWTGSSGVTAVSASTLARNTATVGGALRATDGAVSIFRSTIARNAASTAAAIATDVETDVSVSIVAANRSRNGRPCVGPFASTHNVGTRGTRSCGFDAPTNETVRDASLGPLAAHGGPTPTVALLPGSPAIDVDPGCTRPDQRGVRHAGPCDAGAYEFARCLGVVVNVVGTRHDDELSGGRRTDGIVGQAGNDELQGSIGADGVCGGVDDDRLLGGPGNDRIDGSRGDDRLEGEDGDDVLRAGGGRDLVIGGPGRDVCIVDRHDRVRGCERIRR